jgi:photosystem II stability/assembly factor-like uncharacterized protein
MTMKTVIRTMGVGLLTFAMPFDAGSAGTGVTAGNAMFTLDGGQSDGDGNRPALSVAISAAARATQGSPPGDWVALGPPGGDVSDVAVSSTNPDIVLAGISPASGFGGALYRSADGGDTWAQVPALAGLTVYNVEAAADGDLFAGTQDSVWTSTDDGVSWTQSLLGIGPNDSVLSVVIDPADPDVLWAGVAEAFGSQPVNLMRSADGGATWVNRTPPLAAPMNANDIAIDPGDSDTVIVAFSGGLGGGAVWVTTDGGTTWVDRTGSLPANPLRAVAYDGSRLLVGGGQLFGSQFVGLFESDDLGVTWSALHDGTWPLRVVTSIAIDPNDPDVILAATDGAGINRSSDGGASWDIGVGGSSNLASQSVRYAPDNSSEIFVGASSLAVYRSLDGGDSFAAASNGISELSLFSIHANPQDPLELAAAFQGNNNGGVLTSEDGGVTWQAEPVPATRYKRVRFAPDGTLHALSSGPTTIGPEGLYRRDGDGVWTNLGPDQGPQFESELGVIRFSSNDPLKIWLGGNDFGVAGFEQTIWFTDDGGDTWTKQLEGADFNITTGIEIVEDGLDQEIVAVFDDSSGGDASGALRSTDAGATWTDAVAGLSGFRRSPRLCASVDDPETMFMSLWTSFGASAVFRTDDAASTGWIATPWAGPAINDLVCDRNDPDVLYVAQSATPIIARSDDAGVSFSAFDGGLEAAGDTRELTQMPGAPTGLLLATGRGSFALGGPDGDVIFADGFDSIE